MSINVVQADITNVAPELAGETQGRVGSFINTALLYVDEGAWGTPRATQAVIYLACHLLTVANRKGIGGSISSVKVSDYEQQFRQGTSGEAEDLESTAYGMMYLSLRKTIFKSPIVL